MNIPGSVQVARPWPSTRLQAPDAELRRALATGFAVAGALACARVAWNLVFANDVFLDSWVLVHILGVVEGTVERLPRATLTLQYPFSYLPSLPVSYVLGPLDTVKYFYPVVSSLAAVPAYLMLRNGPAPVLGVFAILLLPDLAVKAMTGTPQGMALPFFVLAFYFAMTERRLPFVLAATAVLFTHHLTGMVTLVLYYTVVAMPHSREPGWLKRELPYLAYFGLWPVYWAWTFYQIDQSYVWPIFLTMTGVVGTVSAVTLYALAPHIDRLSVWLGSVTARLPVAVVAVMAVFAGVVGWWLSANTLDSPGLSSAIFANRAIVAIYASLLVIGAVAVLARQHLGLTLLFGTLGWLGFLVMPTGCHRVFDGLRLADYAILAGLVALFAPGLRARWRQPMLLAAAVLVFTAAGLRLGYGHDRLFAISDAQYAGAEWVRDNVPPGTSIATDTKISLLILGHGEHNATFEGSRWLFDGSPVASTITALNNDRAFNERPITHVMLTDYMLTRGADVGWFGATTVIDQRLYTELDRVGVRVYEQGGVTIWELHSILSVTERRQFSSQSALTALTDRLFGAIPGVGGGICD